MGRLRERERDRRRANARRCWPGQHHRFVSDGTPVATGFAAVGDAWACTNPSGGRGVSIGIIHAQLLRRTVRRQLGDPAAFVQA